MISPTLLLTSDSSPPACVFSSPPSTPVSSLFLPSTPSHLLSSSPLSSSFLFRSPSFLHRLTSSSPSHLLLLSSWSYLLVTSFSSSPPHHLHLTSYLSCSWSRLLPFSLSSSFLRPLLDLLSSSSSLPLPCFSSSSSPPLENQTFFFLDTTPVYEFTVRRRLTTFSTVNM